LLLLIFSLSGTEFGQLLRLPLLVNHYLEHKIEHSDLSIGDFLLIHYSQQHQDGANEEDRQLPFKSHLECAKLFSIASPFPNSVNLLIPLTPEGSMNMPSASTPLSAGVRTMIWQPPRHS
jgi:hypothetical protein